MEPLQVGRYIRLKNKLIGDGQPCYIIAEMSANHGGDFRRALEIVNAAAESGADCIKVQTYTADTITMNSNKRHFMINDGLWKGKNLYSLYKGASMPWEWQPRIKEEAEKAGLDFLSTPFDITAVDFLEDTGVEFYKISSFEIVDIPLLRAAAATGKPIILSTGMASEAEIAEAVKVIRESGKAASGLELPARAEQGKQTGCQDPIPDNLILLKCSSAYPAEPRDMNLKTMQYLKSKFNVAVGFSDHSMGVLSACTAVALGAKVIEKHFCLDRKIKTPDSEFSMEPKEFLSMVESIRVVEQSLGRVSFTPAPGEAVSVLLRKSVFVTSDIRKGDRFSRESIKVIRPAQGMNPGQYERILGMAAATDISAGTPLKSCHILGFTPDE